MLFDSTSPTPTGDGSFSYVLLSSSEHERFSNDVLRSLSAPVGARILFRYSEDIVESSIWTEYSSCEGSRGLVCHANMQNDGRGILVPIRLVSIENAYRPGSTLALELTMEGFAKYSEEELTDDLSIENNEWKEKHPYKKNGNINGNFLFRINNDKIISETKQIEEWEKICMKVHSKGSISEPYYFLVTGVFGEKLDNICYANKWEDYFRVDKNYNIPIYIFSPKDRRDDLSEDSLQISSSVGVDSKNPIDLAVNAPYDLKTWSVRVPSQSLLGTGYEWVGKREGWLQIGPKATEAGKTRPFRWQIDLDLRYGRSTGDFFKAAGLLTPVYGITFFLGLSSPEEFSVFADLITAAAFGFIAAIVTLHLANVSR